MTARRAELRRQLRESQRWARRGKLEDSIPNGPARRRALRTHRGADRLGRGRPGCTCLGLVQEGGPGRFCRRGMSCPAMQRVVRRLKPENSKWVKAALSVGGFRADSRWSTLNQLNISEVPDGCTYEANSDERPRRTRGSYKKTCPYGMNCKFFNVARGCGGSDVCRRFQKSRKRQIALVARASVLAEERREYRLGRATDVARDALDELFDPPQELQSCSFFTSVFVDAFFMEAFFQCLFYFARVFSSCL